MSQWEKIEYKPIPIRELLLEMKNLSELMIDLAYSAALFNDKDLAEDVIELENRIDTMAYLLDMHLMIAARDAKEAETLVSVSKVASAADKISDAAGDIAAMVLRNIGVHPIVGKIFEKVEEPLTRTKVNDGSKLIGKKIGELNLAKIGVDIIAIHRNRDWIIKLEENVKIEMGDILIIRGASSGIKKIKELAERKR